MALVIFQILFTQKSIASSLNTLTHPIVVPYPTKSIADRVIEANTVVLAKESPDKPFSYQAHTALKGSLDDAEKIDLFINSFNRRVLKRFPNRNTVLIRFEDNGEQKWETIGRPDPEIEFLVNEILKNKENWEEDPVLRLDFFAELIIHPNVTIRDLAYLEIGRSPYSEIRKMKGIIPSSDIYTYLEDVQYFKWHPLHILLLGLSDDSYDQAKIKETFYDATTFGIDTRLAAWTTAYIEMRPEEAIESIKEEYFSVPGRDIKEIDAIVAATSAHGNEGHIYLRQSIVESYKILLSNYPVLAASIARDLIAWENWELLDTYREIMRDSLPTFNYMYSFYVKKYIQEAENSIK